MPEMTAQQLQALKRAAGAGKSPGRKAGGRKKPRTAKQKAATRRLVALNRKRRKGTKPRKSPGRKAGGKRKTAAPRKRPAKRSGRKTPTGARQLTANEITGMGLVADLINAQFGASGRLADASPWVRGLATEQRKALLAADRRIRKAAGR